MLFLRLEDILVIRITRHSKQVIFNSLIPAMAGPVCAAFLFSFCFPTKIAKLTAITIPLDFGFCLFSSSSCCFVLLCSVFQCLEEQQEGMQENIVT